MGSIEYTVVTDWERRPWALLSTGNSPGDAEREATQSLRRAQAVASIRKHYIIRRDPGHERALRAFDARTGQAISPPFLMSTITGVRAWMTLNEPAWKECD